LGGKPLAEDRLLRSTRVVSLSHGKGGQTQLDVSGGQFGKEISKDRNTLQKKTGPEKRRWYSGRRKGLTSRDLRNSPGGQAESPRKYRSAWKNVPYERDLHRVTHGWGETNARYRNAPERRVFKI